MFIHWGIYSVPAGEWKDKTDLGEWFLEQTEMPVSEYAKFARQFNPVKFDAQEWVRIAKHAGQDLQFACREVWTGMISSRGVLLKDRPLLLKSFAEGLSLAPGGLGSLAADTGRNASADDLDGLQWSVFRP